MPRFVGRGIRSVTSATLVIRAISILAMLQAAVVILALLGVFPNPRLGSGQHLIGSASVLGVFSLSILSLTVWKRRLWAAYALFAYTAVAAVAKLPILGSSSLLSSLLFVILYGSGAFALKYSDHVAPTLCELNWKKIAAYTVVLTIGHVLISFLSQVLYFLAVNESVALFLALVWPVALFTLAAKESEPWGMETVLTITALMAPILPLKNAVFKQVGQDIVDELLLVDQALRYLLAFALLGWILAECISFIERKRVVVGALE